MAQTVTSQLGHEAIGHPYMESCLPPSAPALHHLEKTDDDDDDEDEQINDSAVGSPSTDTKDVADLEFSDLPPFPKDVPTVPLLRIQLSKLLKGDEAEVDRLWKACCELGFFYLDLRSGIGHGAAEESIDGDKLYDRVGDLFQLGKEVFDLPLEEKIQYDMSTHGRYFGYKGYGAGVIDKNGTKDRNEFYNVSKNDILGIMDPLPGPEVLRAQRPLIKSYMQDCHSIVLLILRLLNTRLGLPEDALASKHRLQVSSGDQLRWTKSPPQPPDDRRTALGEHTDFGSVTVLFNRLGGLQVLPPNASDWAYVKPLKGHAVVNLGDTMVAFTAGTLRSNKHRVVNPPGEQADLTRMSLVYFSRPEDDVLLKVLDGSEIIDENRKDYKNDEKDITAKEWTLRKAGASRVIKT